jgi:hypothetical protein
MLAESLAPIVLPDADGRQIRLGSLWERQPFRSEMTGDFFVILMPWFSPTLREMALKNHSSRGPCGAGELVLGKLPRCVEVRVEKTGLNHDFNIIE